MRDQKTGIRSGCQRSIEAQVFLVIAFKPPLRNPSKGRRGVNEDPGVKSPDQSLSSSTFFLNSRDTLSISPQDEAVSMSIFSLLRSLGNFVPRTQRLL